MAYYFPTYAHNTEYSVLYEQLSTVERGMVLREFVGVTYRRRFQFFKRHHFHAPQRAFKSNLQLAAQRQDKRFRIRNHIWRKQVSRPAYLELIFRHYLLGFVVQLIRKRSGQDLHPESGCYPDAPYVLAALEWFQDNRLAVDSMIVQQVEEVSCESCRHLYLYCLRAFFIARKLCDSDSLSRAVAKSCRSRVGGNVPLGAELEFSNLGYRASFEHSFLRHQRDQPYCNFIYFHHYFLEDVSWRLGGYLDHHVRLRRYLPVPWIGGFFEYNLVRIDYPRRFSLPLTRDPGFLARYIQRVVDFNPQLAPHSMHLNVECVSLGRKEVPTFSDYICMLLLGGDLGCDDKGVLTERRFARNELIKMVQLRQHTSLFDHLSHHVTEFAFIRLKKSHTDDDWLSLILVLLGYNRSCRFDKYCLEPLGELLHWAHEPKALSVDQITEFVTKVRRGLLVDKGLDVELVAAHMQKVEKWLWCENGRIRQEA